MLFDPFEEEFDLPTMLVEEGDGLRGRDGVVSEKDVRPSCCRITILPDFGIEAPSGFVNGIT